MRVYAAGRGTKRLRWDVNVEWWMTPRISTRPRSHAPRRWRFELGVIVVTKPACGSGDMMESGGCRPIAKSRFEPNANWVKRENDDGRGLMLSAELSRRDCAPNFARYWDFGLEFRTGNSTCPLNSFQEAAHSELRPIRRTGIPTATELTQRKIAQTKGETASRSRYGFDT